jgi:uncharacterized membrane protein YedE/YeeE
MHQTITKDKKDTVVSKKGQSPFLFIFLGIFFGFALTKAEVISWFRIQEMFRFESFHMYGIIGMAILVGFISVQMITRFNIRSLGGEMISLKPKKFHPGVLIGGIIFGLGWATTGACPGPLFALIGNGLTVFIVPLLSAVLGTWVYGRFREKLPH